MKRIFTLFIFLFGLTTLHAQLAEEDMVFWLGDGDKEAYLVVDFRDNTEDPSFGWGIRFNEGEAPTMADALSMIEQADAGFSLSTTYNGHYLDGITYNHHEGYDLEPDSWSIWSGDTLDTWSMGAGIGQTLADGRWYGVSYGFMPPVAPTFKYAAYSPDWFSLDDVEYWIGEGEHQAAITIDFVTDEDEEEVTYVWGVKFDDTITGQQALEMVADVEEDLEISIDPTGALESISYNGMEREVDATNSWKAFIGNSMSDYQPTDLEEEITNNKLFGVSFGEEDVRRPYKPTAVEEPDNSVEEPEIPNLGNEDIVFWLGDGDQEAYILVDFRDNTEDPSFGWGVRFNEGEQITMGDALALIAGADSGFTMMVTSGFLNDIIYNHHEGLDSEPDWWSTWSGDAVDQMGMQGGISEPLSDGRWYGVSYGFMPSPVAPTFKYAAYSPDWFSLDDVEYWIGEGEHQAAVTIDFVTDEDEEEVTYVWGVKFDDTITGQQALEMVADVDEDLEINIDPTGALESISYNGMEREVDATNSWKAFIGNSMSDYQPTDLEEEITDNKLFGVSFGEENVRRPFIPMAVEDPNLSVEDFLNANVIKLWPNPASHTIYVESEHSIEQIRIFNLLGEEVLRTKSNTINISTLSSGVYILKLTDEVSTNVHRFIKQ